MSLHRLFLILGLALLGLGQSLLTVPVSPGEVIPQNQTPAGPVPKSTDNDTQTEQSTMFSRRQGPYPYNLKFHLEVEGKVALMSRTRYCRYEDLHLKTIARMEKGQYRYDVVGLSTDHNALNFGIGEGPKRHQRYILLTESPSEQEISRIKERILEVEKEKMGLTEQSLVEKKKGDKETDPDEEDTDKGKKAFFNYFLWKDLQKKFSFSQAYYGTIPVVENDVELETIIKEGGRKARPRFFETLQYALLAIPAFMDPSSGPLALSDNSWKVSLRPIMEGLVNLSKEVYGRKMTLLEPEAIKAQEIHYTSNRVSGTTILRIIGNFENGKPTNIRVSGFKGEIWIEAFRREVLFDTVTGRILKDDLNIEFGIQRNAKILALEGHKNRVRVSLVDQCFIGCPDSDSGIAMAARTCNSSTPGL